jgi:hypothetical protein
VRVRRTAAMLFLTVRRDNARAIFAERPRFIANPESVLGRGRAMSGSDAYRCWKVTRVQPASGPWRPRERNRAAHRGNLATNHDHRAVEEPR